MTKIIFDVPLELNKKINEATERMFVNRASLCRMAIAKFLDSEVKA